jgi:hypothetical protein
MHLEGTASFHTLRVVGKIDKQPLFILVDSGSTHNTSRNPYYKNNVFITRLDTQISSIKITCSQSHSSLHNKSQNIAFF